MRKIAWLIITLFLIQSAIIYPQSVGPKSEFRAAWIATVTNIDWPTLGASTSSQKQALINILDGLKAVNINAVMFQIRPECDALYQSSIEPWSYWLTGQQGRAPNPFYDPLQFAIEEAHKRGMELHAWFNPYRVERTVGSYTTASNHISKVHPEWTFTKGSTKILDPGLPQVRAYVLSVIMDVVRRYDLDGVHFDDYFYLDGMTSEDANTYALYNPTGLNIGDWRRNNVNTLVKMINDSIQAVKPWVKWGISPRGIWKNGVPPGIVGSDNYNVIYCDGIGWLKNHTIDYINPQLYWAFGGGQDYGKLMPWWADSAGAYQRHMYVGHAVYRIGNPFSATEVPRQIRLNRSDPDCQGSVLYNTTSTLSNTLGFYDSLKVLYRNAALVPNMAWKEQIKPNTPTNLRFDKLANARGDGLIWNPPLQASDGDTAARYAVYKFNSPNPQPNEIDNPNNLNNIVGTPYTPLKTSDISQTMYFGVTALDRNYNESTLSNVIAVQVSKPVKPLQIFPPDLATNQRDTVKFVWENTPHSNYNKLQVSIDPNFSTFLFHQNNIVDTFKAVTGFDGLKKYYWRITASNLAGESVYSDVRSFTTGFPNPPQLVWPKNKDTVYTYIPRLIWNRTTAATRYRVIVAEGLSIEPSLTVIDTVVVDTIVTCKKLKENKFYTWTISAMNDYGSSKLADVFRFRTNVTLNAETIESVPLQFVLSQNYPNPFNPSTKISFALPESGQTVLRIYNVLGQQINELINKELPAGYYTVDFNAENYPSGIYIYVLQSGDNVLARKMLLVK